MASSIRSQRILENSDYSITIHKSQETVSCSLRWDLGNYHDLETGKIYTCPLDLTDFLCCSYWELGMKKYAKCVLISLWCYLTETEVDFTIITEGAKNVFISAKGLEKPGSPGTYSGTINRLVIDNPDDLQMRLVVLCKVEIRKDDLESDSFVNPICSCSILRNDLDELFCSQNFSDVTLVKDGKEYPAHKCFLINRSWYWKSRLEEYRNPNKKRFFVQHDENISEEAFIEGLRFLYTGRTKELNAELAMELFCASEMLHNYYLRSRCINALMRIISDQNFLRVYSFALRETIWELRAKAETFFMQNKEKILKLYYEDDGVTLIKPDWIKDEELITLETNLNSLIKGM